LITSLSLELDMKGFLLRQRRVDEKSKSAAGFQNGAVACVLWQERPQGLAMRFHADTGTNRVVEKAYFHPRIVGRQSFIEQTVLVTLKVICCYRASSLNRTIETKLGPRSQEEEIYGAKIHLRQFRCARCGRLLIVRSNDDLGAGDGSNQRFRERPNRSCSAGRRSNRYADGDGRQAQRC